MGPAPQIEFLLSGSSGMLGRALARALSEGGIAWQQLVRREPIKAYELAEVTGDLKVRAVVHLAGANVAAHRWDEPYKAEMRRSRIETTSRLAKKLAELAQRPQVLLVASATGIYGNRGDELLTEESHTGKGYLAELCREWEQAAEPARQAGIRVVHLRFGVVLGGEEGRPQGALEKLVPIFRRGLGGRLGDGRQWMSWVALEDLVRAILFASENAALRGPLNVVAPVPVTNAEFTRALARELHRPALLPVPALALRLAAGEMADEALLASARVVPQRLLTEGFQFEFPVVDLALERALRKQQP